MTPAINRLEKYKPRAASVARDEDVITATDMSFAKSGLNSKYLATVE